MANSALLSPSKPLFIIYDDYSILYFKAFCLSNIFFQHIRKLRFQPSELSCCLPSSILNSIFGFPAVKTGHGSANKKQTECFRLYFYDLASELYASAILLFFIGCVVFMNNALAAALSIFLLRLSFPRQLYPCRPDCRLRKISNSRSERRFNHAVPQCFGIGH